MHTNTPAGQRNDMSTEHRPAEYTDDKPIDINSPQFDSLLHEVKLRCEAAVKDLGEFGLTLGCHEDGSFNVGFGPNMLVRWDVLAALPAPKWVGPR